MQYILLRDVAVEGRRFYNANSFVARGVCLKMETGTENLKLAYTGKRTYVRPTVSRRSTTHSNRDEMEALVCTCKTKKNARRGTRVDSVSNYQRARCAGTRDRVSHVHVYLCKLAIGR